MLQIYGEKRYLSILARVFLQSKTLFLTQINKLCAITAYKQPLNLVE